MSNFPSTRERLSSLKPTEYLHQHQPPAPHDRAHLIEPGPGAAQPNRKIAVGTPITEHPPHRSVRARGQQQSSMGGKIVRTIGIALARFKIGMMNLGSAGSARADGACARLSALTGGVGVSCKRPARRQSGPRSGGPPWHERRNRSLSQSRVLFEIPHKSVLHLQRAPLVIPGAR
jgi:hypothetical protein